MELLCQAVHRARRFGPRYRERHILWEHTIVISETATRANLNYEISNLTVRPQILGVSTSSSGSRSQSFTSAGRCITVGSTSTPCTRPCCMLQIGSSSTFSGTEIFSRYAMLIHHAGKSRSSHSQDPSRSVARPRDRSSEPSSIDAGLCLCWVRGSPTYLGCAPRAWRRLAGSHGIHFA
jgi:hypothetical protein